MDSEYTLEEKCEHLMNIVVESRKRFGKMCTDYEQKTSFIENKNLNLQLETINNYRFKPKTQIPDFDTGVMIKEAETFSSEIRDRQRRVEKLHNKVRNTQEVVMQLKADRVGRKLKEPITADAMLTAAKNKTCL